jgi:N-acetylglucosamine-6-phosphate deacetylase
MAFLETCRQFVRSGTDPARGICRVAGAHLYGPYFAEEKVGCHPRLTRPPTRAEYSQYLAFAPDVLRVATCAPELDGAMDFFRDAAGRGVRLNAGHSNSSWDEMAEAFDIGVRHVDHFCCAMSSYVSVRPRFGTPYRAGMFEFVLATPEMTTEVIADGRHLAPELLAFTLKMKGADKVALVTDSSRAMDMPPGEYLFGPRDGGEPFYHDGEVGLTLDGNGLASGARGLDHMVRHMHTAVGVDLPTAVRMASLTPARILGADREVGSLEVGKRADVVLLDGDLSVREVLVDGHLMKAKEA